MPLAIFRPKKSYNRKPLKTIVTALIAAADPANGQINAAPLVMKLQTVQLCFAKSKIMQPENRLEIGPKRRKLPKVNGLRGNNQIVDNRPNLYKEESGELTEKLAHIGEKKIDYRHLVYVEWLEFLCRLATCAVVFDAKTA